MSIFKLLWICVNIKNSESTALRTYFICIEIKLIILNLPYCLSGSLIFGYS